MKKLILITGLLFLVGCDTPQEKNKKEIQKLQTEVKQLQQLRNKIEIMKTKLNSLKKVSNPKIPDLTEIKSKLTNLQTQINNLKQQDKKNNLDYIVINPTTLITIKNSNIYNSPENNGTIIKTWETHTTFTSYKEKNNFVKITGYFINGKWIENKKNWWIKKSNLKVKVVANQ